MKRNKIDGRYKTKLSVNFTLIKQGEIFMIDFEKINRNKSLNQSILSNLIKISVVFVGLGFLGACSSTDSEKTASASKNIVSINTQPTKIVESTSPSATPTPLDTDQDGTPDGIDFRPNDPLVQNANDVDSDKDGVSDPKDAFPLNPHFSKDTDGDHVADAVDAFPKNSQYSVDSDNDGVANQIDAFPHDPNFSKDTDSDGVADSLDAFPKNSHYSIDSDKDGVADSVDAFPNDSARSKITLSMQNALDDAQGYLDYAAFSRQGLIDQLSSSYGSGYDLFDATWAVNNVGADWYEQAVRSAKEYLSISAFSRQGLIDQLSSEYGEEFTLDQATYAANAVGL